MTVHVHPSFVEKARARYVEAVIVDVLMENWWRMARYDDREMALPAIENIARELRERLSEPVLR